MIGTSTAEMEKTTLDNGLEKEKEVRLCLGVNDLIMGNHVRSCDYSHTLTYQL